MQNICVSGPQRAIGQTSMPTCDSTVAKCSYKLIFLIHKLQALNKEQKQGIDDIADRIIGLDETLTSLQITAVNLHTK